MRQWVQERLSYANIASSLAIFLALGGTSYALTLPRNSVGAKQIRSNAVGGSELRSAAVRSADVRDRSIGVRDLSLSARNSLRGQAGGPGPTGPAGPAGAAGIIYRAAVTSAGRAVRGNSNFETTRGLNEYIVGFDRAVDDCISTATLATVEGGGTVNPPAGRITVGRENGRVLVKTYDAAGSATALPFHLIVAC